MLYQVVDIGYIKDMFCSVLFVNVKFSVQSHTILIQCTRFLNETRGDYRIKNHINSSFSNKIDDRSPSSSKKSVDEMSKFSGNAKVHSLKKRDLCSL